MGIKLLLVLHIFAAAILVFAACAESGETQSHRSGNCDFRV